MKTIFAILALAFGFAFSATIVNVDETGQSIPVMGLRDIAYNLDTSEVDTGDIWVNVSQRTLRSFTDTIGRVWMRCDDSSGTDSVGGRLLWQGNPSPKADAMWTTMDSVSIAVASGAETQTSAPVVNSLRFFFIRFVLKNQLAPGGSAAEKTVCRNLRFNISPVIRQ